MRPVDDYMLYRAVIVQAVSCLLFGAKPYLNQWWLIANIFDPWEPTSVKFDSKYKDFLQKEEYSIIEAITRTSAALSNKNQMK